MSDLPLNPAALDLPQSGLSSFPPAERWDDWMEWQARYMSGAMLMPKSRVCRLVQKFARDKGLEVPLQAGSPSSLYLVEHAIIAFHVSRDAAMVRLKQLGLIA